MITVMRKHHKWLMIVIAILAVPFIFYFNKTDWSARRETDLGRVYDRPVTLVEFQRSVRLWTLAQMMGMSSMIQDMMMRPMSQDEAYVNFAFNRVVLDHETRALGIRPTTPEIVAFVKTLAPFQGANGFDPAKYTEFVQNRLPSLGFNEAQIEEVVSDQLALNRLKDLLGTGLHVADSESTEYYDQAYGKLHVAVVRFRTEDFQKDVKVTDEDVAKYFEAHKAELKTEEKRKVEFVVFSLSEADKKLAGKEKVEALQKVANLANDFVQGTLDKGAKFSDLAAKFNVPVVATGEFTAAAPDPQFASLPQLSQYAFQLKQPDAVSDALQGAEAFYVLHLLNVTPARPLSLEEAKPKISDTLSKEKTRQLIAARAADVSRTVREALNAKTPLDAALSQLGLQAERIAPFSIVENPTPTPAPPKPEDPKKPEEPKKPEVADLASIKTAVRELKPGDASDFVATPNGGLVAVVETREPGDPAGFAAAKATFEKNYLQSKRMVVFDEWLRERRRAAGLQQPPPPTVET
jgi:SurA-like protein/parvulin-like peptidyl-prolyl cis-trans isomerase-like protein